MTYSLCSIQNHFAVAPAEDAFADRFCLPRLSMDTSKNQNLHTTVASALELEVGGPSVNHPRPTVVKMGEIRL